ncbi:MAG: hypothetical protein NXI22_05510 [bacterium]|nr:hypothetical protein [bacterium]
MVNRLLQFWRIRAPQLIITLVIVSLCAAHAPIPVPLGSATGKDLSRPFPCQNRPCGCRTAAQCWKKCCCFSDEEKLAWARQNGVTPPDFVVQNAAEASIAQCAPKASSCGCCAKGDAPAEPALSKEKTGSDLSYIVVIGAFAQHCQGGGDGLFVLPPAIVFTQPRWNATQPFAGWLRPQSIISHGRTAEPPVPPPRLIAAL